MSARSLLFVPGDSDRKIAKSAESGADIVILDLEDSVDPSQKAVARARVGEFLTSFNKQAKPQFWVRINPLDTPEAEADLAAIVGARLCGIVQPKTRSADDVIRLSQRLDELEAQHGLMPAKMSILPVATETPEAIFSLGGFRRCGGRLYGLTWGAEDLAAAIGATGNKESSGAWTAPFQLVRSLCLFGAAAAGVAAIDTLYVDYRDSAGLRASCSEARRDGFSGKLAIHPDQVGVINECFVPSPAEVLEAQRIVGLFAESPGVAALSFDGRMVDIPHLRRAEKTLARSVRLKP